VPISAAAYGFLALVDKLQDWVFTSVPQGLGFGGTPTWWPLPLLTLAGVLVGLAIRYLPGTGGHSPADGFKAGGVASPVELPGIALAALATLSLGAVLGPEAPLIALGGGLAACAVGLGGRRRPPQATAVVGAAGSFAAVSTLLGSPLLGAFLLMEASGLGGPTLGVVLVAGLVAAGVGSLVFVGLDSWTGLGTFSLALPNLPDVASRRCRVRLGAGHRPGRGRCWHGHPPTRPAAPTHVERRLLLVRPLVGLAVGTLAVLYAQGSGHDVSDVLFSGQDQIGPLVSGSATYSVGALLLLIACKGLAYGASLAAFRGPRLPGDVPRRGGWDRAVASCWPVNGPRDRHGHRRDECGAAPAAADLGPAGDPAAGVGRARGDATGDRGRRRRLCGLGQTCPGTGDVRRARSFILIGGCRSTRPARPSP
jgi:hypothetical protein